jgi:adenine-specific DNA-methyltransferase
LTRRGSLVVDPFMGSGSSAVAAVLEERRFAGSDINKSYVALAMKRVNQITQGADFYRPIEKPIYEPNGREAVAKRPSHFAG